VAQLAAALPHQLAAEPVQRPAVRSAPANLTFREPQTPYLKPEESREWESRRPAAATVLPELDWPLLSASRPAAAVVWQEQPREQVRVSLVQPEPELLPERALDFPAAPQPSFPSALDSDPDHILK
jgi:hypothetical protein